MNECVVTFNNGKRKIAMYFTDNDGELQMQMSVEPEFKEGEDPDLPMLLAGTFMSAISAQERKDDEQSEIITN